MVGDCSNDFIDVNDTVVYFNDMGNRGGKVPESCGNGMEEVPEYDIIDISTIINPGTMWEQYGNSTGIEWEESDLGLMWEYDGNMSKNGAFLQTPIDFG